MSRFTNKENFSWVFTLFGTAVGAGILFLPIQAGLAGFWVSLAVSLFICPVLNLSQRVFADIVYRSEPPVDYTEAVAQFLGKSFGWCLRVLFVVFLALLLIAYATALTNGLGEAITGGALTDTWHRTGLAAAVLAIFFTLLMFGGRWLLGALGVLSLALICMLFGISVMLVSFWELENRFYIPDVQTAFRDTLQLFPLLVTSFVFFPAISSMVLAVRKESGDDEMTRDRIAFIVRMTVIVLMFFSLFFAFSVFLAMSPDELLRAEKENISSLTMLGLTGKSTWLHQLGPVISITALSSSFLGVVLGYRESLLGLLEATPANRLSEESRRGLFYLVSFVMILVFAVSNIPVMPLLGEAVAPLCALFLFVVPAVILFRHPHCFKESLLSKCFLLALGILLFSAYLIARSS